jgi:peptidoglycan/xylan/chitin deacetylase (PgdA/CDA1 family)
VPVRESLARLLGSAGALDAALWARARARLPLLTIVTHHHVCEPSGDYPFDPEVADATPAQFRRRMELVARRFNVVGVDEVCAALDGGALPRNPALVTFDDGYRSCLEVATPILRSVGIRAVFFVATSFVTERRLYWWERIAYLVRRAGPRRLRLVYPAPEEVDLAAPGAVRRLLALVKDTEGLDVERFLEGLGAAAEVEWRPELERRLADELILTWDQVRALRDAGMDVESHTRRHRVLETLDAAGLADELAGSRADLARELGRPARAIAYPVGRPIAHLRRVREAVAAAGYEVGFTNASGASWVGRGLDRLDVRRMAVDRGMSDEMFLGQLALPGLAYRARLRPAGTGG